MKEIGQVWEESGRRENLKVRWYGWGHRHKFFVIKSYDEKAQKLIGELENGEKISFPYRSRHWKIYELGDEFHAKAV